MRRFFLLSLLFGLFLAAVPAMISRTEETAGAQAEGFTQTAAAPAGGEETIAVFLPEENKTEDVPVQDYLLGVVAAEMPAEYEPEALKAQALAALSYARHTLQSKDAVAADSIVSAGSLHIYGNAEQSRVNGGRQTVHGEGRSIGSVISAGGTEQVNDGGQAEGSRLTNGGMVTLYTKPRSLHGPFTKFKKPEIPLSLFIKDSFSPFLCIFCILLFFPDKVKTLEPAAEKKGRGSISPSLAVSSADE